MTTGVRLKRKWRRHDRRKPKPKSKKPETYRQQVNNITEQRWLSNYLFRCSERYSFPLRLQLFNSFLHHPLIPLATSILSSQLTDPIHTTIFITLLHFLHKCLTIGNSYPTSTLFTYMSNNQVTLTLPATQCVATTSVSTTIHETSTLHFLAKGANSSAPLLCWWPSAWDNGPTWNYSTHGSP